MIFVNKISETCLFIISNSCSRGFFFIVCGKSVYDWSYNRINLFSLNCNLYTEYNDQLELLA